jgi:hypothetical protein
MKRLIILGLAIFFAVLLTTFPARVAYNWFAPADLQLAGIAGSVWNGSAAEAKAGGAYVRNVTWKFSPASLLSGRIGFETTSNPASGTMRVEIAISPGGALLLSDLSGQLPLDLLHPTLQQNGIRGDLALDFDSIFIENGTPVAAEGSLTIHDFFVPDLSARSYAFVGLVAPTPVTPPSVVNQLRFLGSPNERGQHEFRFEGQL